MIEHIRKLMFGATDKTTGETVSPEENAVAVAAAALLIETAVMDGNLDEAERGTITRLLVTHFQMEASEVAAVIEEAEKTIDNAVELFSFARVLRDDFEHADRVEMIEMLWEVAYADDVIHDYEANLIRRVTGLLHVTDRESGEARKRVVERLDNNGAEA